MRIQCMNCGSEILREFIDLGQQPNGNNFLYPEDKASEPMFPLKMLVCESCWQVQIDEFPDPEFMFSNHPYVTGINVPVVEHFTGLASHVVEKCGLERNDLVIDVGCNDGTLLRAFEQNGLRTLGVDPGKRTGELAREQGKVVFETFFSEDSGQALHHLGIRPDVVTATAVFYHIPDLHDFVRGLRWLMTERTTFVVQCVSISSLIKKNEFDHFYHEHSCIHGVGPLKRLFDSHEMKIVDVEESEIHGGSFILYVTLNISSAEVSTSVEQAIRAETAVGLNCIDAYLNFEKRVRANTEQVREFLEQEIEAGKRVVALGAPVKGSTFLNYAGIDVDLVECAVEVNQFKVGRLVPGTSIPVIGEDQLSDPPDYYLVLAWNFLEFFKSKYSDFLRSGGKFIVAIPEFNIVSGE